MVDIRPAAQRASEGAFTLDYPQENPDTPESDDLTDSDSPAHKVHIIERNVLEWRLDPQSDAKTLSIMNAHGYDTRVVVVCSEGYTSSLAASELQRLGLCNATDLDGGYWAWKAFLEGKGSGSQRV